MTAALRNFEESDRETARGTVIMLHNATDAPALRVRQCGRDAAPKWLEGDKAGAGAIFRALLDDPEALPREVEPSTPPPGATGH